GPAGRRRRLREGRRARPDPPPEGVRLRARHGSLPPGRRPRRGRDDRPEGSRRAPEAARRAPEVSEEDTMETKRTIAVLALVLAAAGCSGGGGGSGGGASVAAATSATAPTVPMNVTLRSHTSTVVVGQTVDLALSASQVSGLYGAGVDLSYDP